MNEIIKGYELAEKELKQEKQEELKNKIKGIVKETLEKIDSIDKQEKELAEKKKILKKDIDDLKAGRLDLIEERQKNSQIAKDTSMFTIALQNTNYPPIYYYTCTSGTGTVLGWQTSNWVSGTYTINGHTIYL